jgi:NAD(P)-dependent dehydrogenase (short-subunit alcohol dehydrogenase family)
MQLKDAVALITGGSEGIGRAIAEALAAEGARVTLPGRNEDRLRATAKDLGVDCAVGDEGSEADATRTVAHEVAKHGRLDILVNNAGYAGFKPLVQMTLADL